MYPTRPETGYGYIKANGMVDDEIFEVEGFKEKPDLKTAQSYLQEGGYYWNAGIFLWNVKTIEQAFRKEQPEIVSIFDGLEQLFYTSEEQKGIDMKFPECPNISIDYAIMEKARNIFVFPANFGWSDLGTWGSLYEQLEKDEAGNACVGNVHPIESEGCVVHVSENKKVVIQGLKDYIVAEENDVILICRKAYEQRIKEFSKS
jgi:mannose-1-phosphate guanylyltransferase